MKRIVTALILVLYVFLSPGAFSETVKDAQTKLQQLNKRNNSYSNKIEKLKTQREELVNKSNKIKVDLELKRNNLSKVSNDMQKAIENAMSAPTPDNEKKARELSNAFTLAESAVRVLELRLERTDRKYNDTLKKLDSNRIKQIKLQANIDNQKIKISSLKKQELAKKAMELEKSKNIVEAEKPIDVKKVTPKIAPTKPPVKTVKPLVAKTTTNKKPVVKAVVKPAVKTATKPKSKLSLDQQLQNIDDFNSESDDWR